MSQQTILLLHGALGSQGQFEGLKKALANSFEVHTLNFEGHGGRISERPFLMHHFVENVMDYLDNNQLSSVTVFGYSMGGYVALMLAQMHPNRVKGMITLGTKFDWTPEFSAAEVRKLNPAKIAEKVPRFAQFLEKVHAPLDWKKVVTNTADMMINLGNDRPLEKHYSTIAAPTLIALGSLDNMSTEEESKLVAEKLPNGQFQLLPNVEHPIEKVDHQYLSKTIIDFIEA